MEYFIEDGVDYCNIAKTSYKIFCLAALEKSTKEFPLEFYLVMNVRIRLRFDGYPFNSSFPSVLIDVHSGVFIVNVHRKVMG